MEVKKRYQAKQQAQRLLERQQQSLQMQRSQAGHKAGTPIVKNGRVVGYAVQVDSNASQLPTLVFPNAPHPTAVDLETWPELEDYSLLEPEVLLEVKDAILVLKDIKPPALQTGSRQILVNGKLLTLVPYQGSGNGVDPQTASRLPIIAPKKVSMQQHASNEEVKCDKCNVKLPKSIMPMHMKMRHMNPPNPTSEAAEIQVIDEDDSESSSPPRTSPQISQKRPLPELIELNPTFDDNEDPLTDPLAI